MRLSEKHGFQLLTENRQWWCWYVVSYRWQNQYW